MVLLAETCSDRLRLDWAEGLSYLASTDEVPAGLGLYSYLLLPSANPGSLEAMRTRSAFAGAQSPRIGERLISWVAYTPQEKGVMFLVVRHAIIETPQPIENYDFPRSAEILKDLGYGHVSGPMVVAGVGPQTTWHRRGHLCIDLSKADPKVIAFVVPGFKTIIASHEGPWRPDEMPSWSNSIRNKLQLLAGDFGIRLGLADVVIQWHRQS